ncbi:MAG: hypothetical protein JXR84_02180 [Anaerolineae bacterium]|nr:hypothetical protein [Anaerolineae bacterium]
MNGIPGDLHERLQAVLLRCGPFDSDRALRPLFVDARLSAWRDLLPEASSRVKRVRAVIDELSQRENPSEENALALLLRVLAENTPPGNACRGQLAALAGEVAAALRADALSGVAPEHSAATPTSSNQPGIQVGTQINVAGNYYAAAPLPAQKLPAQAQGGITIIGDGNVVGNGNTVNVQKGTATAAPATLSSVDVPVLRARLQRLDAVEIESLCLDHFPGVYDKFGRGIRRDEMINLLLDHCRHNPDDAARLAKL